MLQTIAIDTLFSLKKRVREAQREKLNLRERIIEIRAEREQVALRMDAVRAKHDEDSKEALVRLFPALFTLESVALLLILHTAQHQPLGSDARRRPGNRAGPWRS